MQCPEGKYSWFKATTCTACEPGYQCPEARVSPQKLYLCCKARGPQALCAVDPQDKSTVLLEWYLLRTLKPQNTDAQARFNTKNIQAHYERGYVYFLHVQKFHHKKLVTLACVIWHCTFFHTLKTSQRSPSLLYNFDTSISSDSSESGNNPASIFVGTPQRTTPCRVRDQCHRSPCVFWPFMTDFSATFWFMNEIV